MPDTDRDSIPADRIPEGAGGLTDQAGDPGRAPDGPDAPPSIEDLPAPRASAGGDPNATPQDPARGSAPATGGTADATPSQGSVGAADVDPTIDRETSTPIAPDPNPTAPEALDPGVMPRDDVPPVGSSPASATGGILSQEDTANPTDPDGPAEAIPGGAQPDDTPDGPGLAESSGPGDAPPLG